MNLFELFKMAILNLWNRKLRAGLNLIGIVIGGAVLLMTAAGARGLKHSIEILFDSSEYAREIEVVPGDGITDQNADAVAVDGEMSEARRKRIQKRLQKQRDRERRRGRRVYVKPDFLAELEKDPNVVEVVPETTFACKISVGGQASNGTAAGVAIQNPSLRERILFGRMLDEDDTDSVLIHEFLAYQLGFPRRPAIGGIDWSGIDYRVFRFAATGNDVDRQLAESRSRNQKGRSAKDDRTPFRISKGRSRRGLEQFVRGTKDHY